MTKGLSKIERMKLLSESREAQRHRFIHDAKALRENLSPQNLVSRLKFNARIEARQKAKEAVALAKAKPGAAAAVGGLALAAILWTPAKFLYKYKKERDALSQEKTLAESDDIEISKYHE